MINRTGNIKEKLVKIYNSVLDATSPRKATAESIDLQGRKLTVNKREFEFEKVFVVGFGKASCTMAQGIEDVIPIDLIEGGVVTKYGHAVPLAKIKAFEAGHPIPDNNSLAATGELIKILEKASEKDLVIFLISGGGSALLELPKEGITLSDMQKTTDLLLRSEAKINEINVIRKHLSCVKGGGLARIACPASFVSLILSDVIGSDLSSIASGPATGDPSTFSDSMEIIEKYNLKDKIPSSVKELFLKGKNGDIPDTPFPDDPLFKSGFNYILADNKKFCRLIGEEARKENIKFCYIKTDLTTSTAEDLNRGFYEFIEAYKEKAPILLIMGGEVTLTVPEGKNGLGGRNQHLALLFARDNISHHPEAIALFASTDGTDGPTDANGAFSHSGLVEKLSDKSELDDAIDNCDSYHFLKKYDELFITGPTGNNLNDVFLIYIDEKE